MTETLTGLCNQCGKLTNIDFKIKHHPNKIQEHYFKCEHCFYHYTSYVTDSKVRKLQKKLRTLIGTGKRWEPLHQEIGQRMDKLKYNIVNFGRADL